MVIASPASVAEFVGGGAHPANARWRFRFSLIWVISSSPFGARKRCRHACTRCKQYRTPAPLGGEPRVPGDPGALPAPAAHRLNPGGGGLWPVTTLHFIWRQVTGPRNLGSWSASRMRSVLVALLLAVAVQAADPPACKWSWKSFGCLPKDSCRIKPRFGSWCVATTGTAEPAKAAPAKAEPAAEAEPAAAQAAPAADDDAADKPSSEESGDEEIADHEEM